MVTDKQSVTLPERYGLTRSWQQTFLLGGAGAKSTISDCLIIHAGIAAGVDKAFSRVCLSVCPRSNKKNGLSYQHQIWYTYTLWQSLGMHWPRGQKVKGQGHIVTKTVTVARLLVTMARIQRRTNTPLCYLRPLLAWVCMSIRLPMFSSFNLRLSPRQIYVSRHHVVEGRQTQRQAEIHWLYTVSKPLSSLMQRLVSDSSICQ